MSRREWPDLPFNRWLQLAVLSPLFVALGAAFWRTPVVALPSILVGLLIQLLLALNVRQADRIIVELCTDNPPISLIAALKQISAQVQSVRHRFSSSHPVTGLPTREKLQHEIAADADGPSEAHLLAALRFADFTRLAAFDRSAANAALAVFAGRLRTALKSDHLIGHIDRDCFGLWFRTGGDIEAALAQLRAVIYVSAQEFTADDRILTPSIEVSSIRYPDDGVDAFELLDNASASLAPASGALQDLTAHAPVSQSSSRERFALEQDLAQAIVADQLSMVFQPVVDVAQARLIGAEALLRWNHPTLGPISPVQFIPVMEAIGLSERFGFWVLNTACREARRWQDEGLSGLKVAVNLSARQLLDPQLCAKVDRTLRRHGLDAGALELELTETAAMTDAARTLQLFGELRALGVSLAIDDFGTGYSSLSYLKNLPFDKLKIDREFVNGVDTRRDSQAICKALIELGRGLNLLVLAEGAETEMEVEALRSLGCDVFQGYLFSKPLPADDFLYLALDPSWVGKRYPPPLPPLASDAA